MKKYALGVVAFVFMAFIVAYVQDKGDGPISKLHHQAVSKAQFVTLNQLIPDLSQFAAFIDDKNGVRFDRMARYELYYQKVAEAMPNLFDAYYMQGFCAYEQGKIEQAAKLYEKAIHLNSEFFWSYYNLGVTLLRLGKNEEAVMIFQRGLKLNPVESIKAIFSSHIFLQIYHYQTIAEKDLPSYLMDRLSGGYKQANMLSMVSCYKAKRCDAPSDNLKNMDTNTLTLKIY